MTEQIDIIRSNRKTISVEIKQDLRIIVRAPICMRMVDIQKFIDEKTPWIEKHLQKLKARKQADKDTTSLKPFTEEEIRELGLIACEKLSERVEELANIIGVTYGGITVRNQVSRWGSCSSKGNLNLNCLLMLCPDEVRDYVIIHELCHLKHMDHSKSFWAMVEKYCPEYKERRKWLKDVGSGFISRLR